MTAKAYIPSDLSAYCFNYSSKQQLPTKQKHKLVVVVVVLLLLLLLLFTTEP